MSEEKLYMVKNDEGSYIAVTNGWLVHWHENSGDLFSSYQEASKWATTLDGHVVTLIEEPEKVVLTKEQAKIIDDAHGFYLPASHISRNSDEDEELLMNAYVNGYTVAKEKKYNVKVPHTKDVWYYKESEAYLQTICPAGDKKLRGKFTEAEIKHYGLQDCEKEEVTDDDK